LDFKAIIKKKDGSFFKVLIELQKSKQVFDVMRFRHYLGDNYRKEDQMMENDGKVVFRTLPIITIYFLGFLLNNVPSGVIKVKREYVDAVTEEILGVKDDFVELLSTRLTFKEISTILWFGRWLNAWEGPLPVMNIAIKWMLKMKLIGYLSGNWGKRISLLPKKINY
jgi:hypothetical protein